MPLWADESCAREMWLKPFGCRPPECNFLVLVHQELDHACAVFRAPYLEVLDSSSRKPLNVVGALLGRYREGVEDVN